MKGLIHSIQGHSGGFPRLLMSLRKTIPSILLPSLLLLGGFVAQLPALGAAAPVPSDAEGCTLIKVSPNDYLCVGSCPGSGDPCSTEVSMTMNMSGDLSLTCGANCGPVSGCKPATMISAYGETSVQCYSVSCNGSCTWDGVQEACVCEGS